MCKISYVADDEENYDYLTNAVNLLMQNYKIDCNGPLIAKRNLMSQEEDIIIIKPKDKCWSISQIYTKIKHSPDATAINMNFENNSCILQIGDYKFIIDRAG